MDRGFDPGPPPGDVAMRVLGVSGSSDPDLLVRRCRVEDPSRALRAGSAEALSLQNLFGLHAAEGVTEGLEREIDVLRRVGAREHAAGAHEVDTLV